MTDIVENSKQLEPNAEPSSRPCTAPNNISVNLRGFESEERATTFGNLIAQSAREISRYMDLSALDGLTVAFDYTQALLELDRGYVTSYKLTPSERFATGVAMTPAVIRDGQVKSHILFNAYVVLPLEDRDHELFGMALHTLAHECAHVEVTEKFNRAFPGTLLQKAGLNFHDYCRWEIIKACWDEYAVTSICARYGTSPTSGYEETFISSLNTARQAANDHIKSYRSHADLNQIITEVYGDYGTLMKFASYHIGNMVGLGLTIEDLPVTQSALNDHWFSEYFHKLASVLSNIMQTYGEWKNKGPFEALGDLADEIVAEGGVIISEHDVSGGFHVDIPW